MIYYMVLFHSVAVNFRNFFMEKVNRKFSAITKYTLPTTSQPFCITLERSSIGVGCDLSQAEPNGLEKNDQPEMKFNYSDQKISEQGQDLPKLW